MNLKYLIAGAVAALGLWAPASKAATLPGCIPNVTCLQFGDFNVFSLPILNLQAGAGVPGPGDPWYVPSNNGAVNQFTVIGRNNGQAGAGNIAGMDGAFNTPSNNTASFFSTASGNPADPGGLGQFTGDAQSWDARITSVNTALGGTPLVAFFAFNETGQANLLGSDLLIWAKVTLCNDAGNTCANFYLSGDGSANTPDETNLPGQNDPLGPWVYVHEGVCATNAGVFTGFPVNGACPAGSTVRNQNTGQDNAAFMINSPALDAAINSGLYDYMQVTWKMGHLNGGGETAWFQAFTGPNQVPEPASLALLGLGFAVMGLAGRRRRRIQA